MPVERRQGRWPSEECNAQNEKENAAAGEYQGDDGHDQFCAHDEQLPLDEVEIAEEDRHGEHDGQNREENVLRSVGDRAEQDAKKIDEEHAEHQNDLAGQLALTGIDDRFILVDETERFDEQPEVEAPAIGRQEDFEYHGRANVRQIAACHSHLEAIQMERSRRMNNGSPSCERRVTMETLL